MDDAEIDTLRQKAAVIALPPEMADQLNRQGVATVRLVNGELRRAEVHWYEAHGVGKRKMKTKRFLD